MIEADLTRKLNGAGIDLAAMAIQWGQRPTEPPPLTVTARDLRLLRFLHDFNYATSSALAALFWGRYASAVRERLKLLHDAGLVDKLRPRVGRTQGSPEWIYRLTETGWKTLAARGKPAEAAPYKPAKLTSISYVEHDTLVSSLVTTLAAQAAAILRRTGPLIDAAPFTLLGPRAGTIDPRQERRAADASAGSDLHGRRVDLGDSYPGTLKPDATFLGTDHAGNRTAVMLEFDRTRRPLKMADRFRRYDWFLTLGWRESRYANLDIEPALLVVCDDDHHLQPLARVADLHVEAVLLPGPDSKASREFPGREQTGLTSRGRLLAGDDCIVQVASRREPRSGVSSRQNFLALPALFCRPIPKSNDEPSAG